MLPKLNNDNYFSSEQQMHYFGVSQYKAFEECPASALAEIKGEHKREMTTSLLVGSYVDAYFEGTLGKFITEHPEIINSKTKELKKDYQNAEYIIRRLSQDKMFMDYMSGEKQVIMTGEISGVPIKIKVDSLHDDKIVDLKIMKDFKCGYKEGQGRLSWVEFWRYDLQGAIYQEIVRQNTGKTLPFYLAAATKEKEPDMAIVALPQDYLDLELERFSEQVPFYQAIKQGAFEPDRCEKCDYCKKTKVLNKVMNLEDLNFYE